MNKKIFLITLIFSIILSCEKFTSDELIEKPPHLLADVNLFTDYNGFQSGLNGLYALVRDERKSYIDSDYPLVDWAISGTDIYVTNSMHNGEGPTKMNALFGDVINPFNEYISAMFAWLYQIVNTANNIIKNAENEEVDWNGGPMNADLNKSLVIAEARAIRAWAYRHLTYTWGDVPLSLDPSSGALIKTDWERTPVIKIREQIINDLLFAEKFVSVEGTFEGRITKGAIQHYLAEMYLILNKPEDALFWANEVIKTPEYKLITERYGVKRNEPGVVFMDMFMSGNQNRSQGNTEALWVFQYALNTVGGGFNHMRRHYGARYGNYIVAGITPLTQTVERGGRSATRSSLTNFALELYKYPESGKVTKRDILNYRDDRMSNYAIRWFFLLKTAEENAPYAADKLPSGYSYGDTIWLTWDQDITIKNNTIHGRPFLRKLDAGVDPNDVAGGYSYDPWIYLRLANTYLLKAEAQYKLNDLHGAAETINVIRRRANALEISAEDVDLDFILDERARELAVEEERKYTLFRTEKWFERTRAHNFRGGQFIEDRHRLLPIPQDVIDTNFTKPMPQNPGY